MDEGVAQLFTLEMNNRKNYWNGWCTSIWGNSVPFRAWIWRKMYVWKLSQYKACWVKPNDIKSDEFKEFRRIKQKF
jgi:peptide chain release factor 3